MKYLDPKNDLTFKRVFGRHPHLLWFMTEIDESTTDAPKDLLTSSEITEALEKL